MNAQAGGCQNRAQVCDRRTLAIGAGDMNDRRQLALGMVEPLQQPLHPLQTKIDTPGVQRGQPRHHFAKWRRWPGRGRVHA